MKVDLQFRRLRELKELIRTNSTENYLGLPLSRRKAEALAACPWFESDDESYQKVGIVDGKVAGGEFLYPVKMQAQDEIYYAGSGSTTVVYPEYRKSDLGMMMAGAIDPNGSKKQLGCAAGLSQIAVRIKRVFDWIVFEYPRLIMLWKSRAFLEKAVKIRIVCLPLQLVVDAGLLMQRCVLRFFCFCRLPRFRISEIKADDENLLSKVASMTAEESKAFSEVHDVAWFKWHLANTFSDTGDGQKLYGVWRKDELVAFFMTKKRFHKQASSRGFRNVWLGSIIEWGSVESTGHLMKWILLKAALLFIKVDAVEIPMPEKMIEKFLRHCGCVQVGKANYGFIVWPSTTLVKYAGYKDFENWRIRPAMCDNGIS